MLPPSWKSEVQKAVEETTNTARDREDAERQQDATAVSEQIKRLVDSYNCERKKPERKDQIKRFLDIGTFLLLLATAIFTGLAWWVFHGQLQVFQNQLGEMQKVYAPIKEQADAAKQSAQTASDALTKAQRAFVFEKDIFYGPTTKNGKKIWRGAFRWENSGLTPAKNANISFVCTGIPGFPAIADPYAMLRLPAVASMVWNTSRSFPPKDIEVGGECEFMNDELLKAQNRQYTEYSIAQVIYTDIFDVSHVTRFCEIAYDVEGNVTGFGNDVIVTGVPCVRYNCTDDECKKEDAEPNLPPDKLVPPSRP